MDVIYRVAFRSWQLMGHPQWTKIFSEGCAYRSSCTKRADYFETIARVTGWWSQGFSLERSSIMRNLIDIDQTHSRAIVQEIGERLRGSLRVDPELPSGVRMQIDRLRRLEGGPARPLPSDLRIGVDANRGRA